MKNIPILARSYSELFTSITRSYVWEGYEGSDILFIYVVFFSLFMLQDSPVIFALSSKYCWFFKTQQNTSPEVIASEFQSNSKSSPVENFWLKTHFTVFPLIITSDCKGAGDTKD